MPLVILLIMVILLILVAAGPIIERWIDRLWPPADPDAEPTVSDSASRDGASPPRSG